MVHSLTVGCLSFLRGIYLPHRFSLQRHFFMWFTFVCWGHLLICMVMLRVGVILKWRRVFAACVCRLSFYVAVYLVINKLHECVAIAGSGQGYEKADADTGSSVVSHIFGIDFNVRDICGSESSTEPCPAWISTHVLWYQMSQTALINIPLYVSASLPSTGNGTHAILLIIFIAASMRLRFIQPWGPKGSEFRSLGLFSTVVGFIYNLNMEKSFRTFLYVYEGYGTTPVDVYCRIIHKPTAATPPALHFRNVASRSLA